MIELSNKPNIKLNKERIKELDKYLAQQEDFITLAKKAILSHYKVQYLKEELDIDKLSDKQMTRLDQCKDEKTRELYLKELPKHKVAYSYLYIRPNYIGDEVNKEDKTLDELDTATIKTINDWLEAKLTLYKTYLN